ncbi:hypothetical protein Bbelb_383160 [Branchiostoma belcheri]|nr:hypothetical protein Bbelb_383160 [Branchiostoma belcheri]
METVAMEPVAMEPVAMETIAMETGDNPHTSAACLGYLTRPALDRTEPVQTVPALTNPPARFNNFPSETLKQDFNLNRPDRRKVCTGRVTHDAARAMAEYSPVRGGSGSPMASRSSGGDGGLGVPSRGRTRARSEGIGVGIPTGVASEDDDLFSEGGSLDRLSHLTIRKQTSYSPTENLSGTTFHFMPATLTFVPATLPFISPTAQLSLLKMQSQERDKLADFGSPGS